MPENIELKIDASSLKGDLTEGLSEAAVEVERIARDQIAPAAALIEDAFSAAAGSIQSNLARAARRGEISLKKLSSALLRDLRRFAIDSFVRKPIQNLLTNALSAPFGGASFGGGRADGGFVASGQHYLVGERGPELFSPGQSGNISPLMGGHGAVQGGGAMVVNISLPGVSDAESFRRSETQISAALARAVGRGQRNL